VIAGQAVANAPPDGYTLELHVLRARLNGGIRNKAARGELRRGLPVGFVWGDADGEIRFHPDEAVVSAIRNVFARFAETGSARRVWLWFRSGNPRPHHGGDRRGPQKAQISISRGPQSGQEAINPPNIRPSGWEPATK
jgi:hypothetical protein